MCARSSLNQWKPLHRKLPVFALCDENSRSFMLRLEAGVVTSCEKGNDGPTQHVNVKWRTRGTW